MISVLELRHIVETAFLPKKCICSISPRGSMTVQIFNQETGMEELTVAGIDSSRIVSSRAIAALVAEINEEMRFDRLRIASHQRQA